MKKRLFFILLTIAVLLSFMLPTSAAADALGLRCTAGAVGEDGSCDIAVELSNAEGISMMQFTLYYDPEKLTFLGAEPGALFSGTLAPTLNTGVTGEIILSWDSITPLQGGGTALLLHMRLIGTEPAEIIFGGEDDVVLARDDFQPLAVDCSGCIIKKQIQPTPVSASQPTPTPAVVQPMQTPASIQPTQIPVVAQPTPTPVVVQPTPTPVITQSQEETFDATEDKDDNTDESQVPTMQEETPALGNANGADSVQASTPTPGKPSPTPAAARLDEESNGLTMTETSLFFSSGESQTLSVQEDEPILAWSSSDERVATVDDNGTVTAHEEGTALITASNEDGTAYASCAVTVNSAVHDEVQPSPEQEGSVQSITVQKNDTQEEKATVTPDTAQAEVLPEETDTVQNVPIQEDSNFPTVPVISVAVCILIAFFLFRKSRRQVNNKTTEENK